MILLNNLKPEKGGFAFECRPRKIEPKDGVPWRWPKNSAVADDYIMTWRDIADAELGRLSLSRETARAVASHLSRKSGEFRMTDAMLASRTGRSAVTIGRDIRRLKDLGLISTRYEAGHKGRERVRVITLTLPLSREVVSSTGWGGPSIGGPINGVDHVDDVDSIGGTLAGV
ncbi:hypothetical protein GVN24_27380 [Rhizobium sp. CRIBSB]|nr:hypothetical protein [Rhizobium sp. CRIBSB]